MYLRAMPDRVETPAAREPTHVNLKLAPREQHPVPKREERPEPPSLMERLRDRICEELPVVSTVTLAPLPISSPDGTRAGLGVFGRF